MRIFLTGASGFIGKHVLETLVEDHDLLVLAREPKKIESLGVFQIISGDLSTISDWKVKLTSFKPEAAIHLAWEGIPDYGHDQSLKNLTYGVSLFKALKEAECVRVVSSGSCWEYGTKKGKLSEDDVATPTNSFTAAKHTLYHMGKDIFKNDASLLWARLFYVYGPGQKESSLIPSLISSYHRGKTPEVKTPGAKNDFVYVNDAAFGLSRLVENGSSGIYNIGSGISTSVSEVMRAICSSQKVPYIELESQAGSEIDFCANISKIKNENAWEPVISLEEGIFASCQYILKSR